MLEAADPLLEVEPDRLSQVPLTALLLSISKKTRAIMGLKLVELGLHNGQDELLLAVRGGQPLHVSLVAKQLNVRPSTVSKMLDRLIKKGLVARISDKNDGRRTFVQITASGQVLCNEVLALHQSFEHILTEKLVGDPAVLTHALSETEELLRNRLQRLR
ncbi:MarR family winged helix-turn-helix transcriptional regulator [Aureimonas sp. AU22]|jgi:MarR family transcriptional regulator, organic hydroperoxide resistance regulator|uniref:MarR family winged helix-turn-helix transcriptional regulator n=1 Tax=Aureimonas sp. AU22 TaxID=1638162 RepID=UPI000782934F|nr:winged helix DNA-binding protein [Aureimonas sp. AU22]